MGTGSALLGTGSVLSLTGPDDTEKSSPALYSSRVNLTPRKTPMRQSPLRQSPMRQSPMRQSPLRTERLSSTPQMHTLQTPGPSAATLGSPGLADSHLHFEKPPVTIRSLRDKLRDAKEHYGNFLRLPLSHTINHFHFLDLCCVDEMKEEMQSSQRDSSLLT